MTYLADMDTDNPLASLQAAACSNCIALGPRAGQKVLSLRTVAARDEKNTRALCADAHGFSLHAGVRCRTHLAPGTRTSVPHHHASGDRHQREAQAR